MGYKVKKVFMWKGNIPDMQGPAPSGFHVPTKDEWQAIYDAYTGLGLSSGTDFSTYFKLPNAGYRMTDKSITGVGSYGYYWSSSPYNRHYAYRLGFGASTVSLNADSARSYGQAIRCIKNSPVTPTSSWTVLYQGTGDAGIFWNQTEGLISISSDGTTWYTIMDKNLGATTVYNNGNTLTNANCGNVFQWGNNYAFPGTKSNNSIRISNTRVDTTGYGPGNYYNSSTWINYSGNWSSVNSDNLRGGVTGPLVEKQIYPAGWKPGANTVAYYPLETNGNEASGKSGLDITTTGITFSNNVAVLNGNQRPTVNSITGYKTICFWFKKTNDFNGMVISQGDTGGYIQLRTNGFSAGGSGGGSFNNDYTAGGSTPSNVWRLCAITQTAASNSGASSGSMKFYLSDFGGVNGVRQYDTTNHYLNWGINRIGWSGNTTYPYALIGEISQLIVESTERTAQEIQDYYNQTKSKYGL